MQFMRAIGVGGYTSESQYNSANKISTLMERETRLRHGDVIVINNRLQYYHTYFCMPARRKEICF